MRALRPGVNLRATGEPFRSIAPLEASRPRIRGMKGGRLRAWHKHLSDGIKSRDFTDMILDDLRLGSSLMRRVATIFLFVISFAISSHAAGFGSFIGKIVAEWDG